MSQTTYTETPLLGGVDATDARVLGVGSHIHRRISWAAIVGGVLLTVAIQIMLSTLGAGIGLGTVDVRAGTTPTAATLGMGAGIWWTLTSVISIFIGGYVSAWMAGIELRFDGMLHGLITWAIAMLATLYLVTSAATGIVTNGAQAVGSVASAAGTGIADVAKPVAQAAGVTPDMLQQQAQAYLQPTNPDPASMSPQDAQKEVATNLATYAAGGGDAAAAKERVITIMATRLNISHDDAARRFDENEAKAKQARDQAVQSAKKAADQSASAGSTTSFAAFGLLVLGAIAGGLGGSIAGHRRTTVGVATRTRVA